MGYLDGFVVTFTPDGRGSGVTRAVRRRTRAASATSRCASTAATSSTATRTAWRSASAASCAPACARPAASTCAAPTTRPTTRSRPGERYGFVYEINYLRCIHCDLCVEACPTEAITETKLFEFSLHQPQRRHLHQGRAAGRRRRPAPAAAVGGLARRARTSHTSAWMRATVAVGRRRLRGPGRPGRASSATACRDPETGQAGDDRRATADPADDGRRPRRDGTATTTADGGH